ncbi:tyrosine-type recombinase/integrase [Neisseria sp. P0004.S004]|uniref:tyrosine-type recombinase/integrase n=1 Tax=unclassified Neisseria TaxID=2623750 RepID=UPI003F80D844
MSSESSKQYNLIFSEFTRYLRSKKYAISTIKLYQHKLQIYGHILQSLGYRDLIVLCDPDVFKKTLFLYHRSLNKSSIKRREVSSLNQYIASWHCFRNWFCFTRNLKVSSQKVKYFKMPDSMVNLIPMCQISVQTPKNEHDVVHLRNWCILDLIYHAGLRNCELSRLQIRNFIQHEQALHLDNRFKRPRIVYLDYVSTYYLEKYLKLLPHHYEMPNGLNTKFPLFTKRNGTAVTRNEISKVVTTSILGVLRQPITPRTLRKICVYNYLIASNDVRAVQTMMGYKNVSSIQKYYSHDISSLRKDLKKAPHRFHWNPKDTF